MKRIFFLILIAITFISCKKDESTVNTPEIDDVVIFRNVRLTVVMSVAAGSGNPNITYTNETGGESQTQDYMRFDKIFKFRVGTKVSVSASCESGLNNIRRSIASVSIKIYNENIIVGEGYDSKAADNIKVTASAFCSAVIY